MKTEQKPTFSVSTSENGAICLSKKCSIIYNPTSNNPFRCNKHNITLKKRLHDDVMIVLRNDGKDNNGHFWQMVQATLNKEDIKTLINELQKFVD